LTHQSVFNSNISGGILPPQNSHGQTPEEVIINCPPQGSRALPLQPHHSGDLPARGGVETVNGDGHEA